MLHKIVPAHLIKLVYFNYVDNCALAKKFECMFFDGVELCLSDSDEADDIVCSIHCKTVIWDLYHSLFRSYGTK